MSRAFVLCAFAWAVLGLLLGLVMAESGDHGQLVTHAHTLLAGFVVSFVYALCHRLWLRELRSVLARVQFWIHQAGVLVLLCGLFLFYGGFYTEPQLAPLLGGGSVAVFIGMLLMGVMVARSPA